MNSIHQATQAYLQDNNYKCFTLKAVLFDMDGVIYNSMPNHAFSWAKVMQSHGFNMSEEEAYLHEGRKGDETISIISKHEGRDVGADERKRIYQEKTELFGLSPDILPIKGSLELLHKVTGSGLFVMLVTGSGQPTLLDRLNNDFPNIFTRERMITSFDVKNGKPHPEPYLQALQKGNLKPDETIVVENAPLGIESARAAGLFVIAVNTGPLPDSILLDAGANILFPSVEALTVKWDQVYSQLRIN